MSANFDWAELETSLFDLARAAIANLSISEDDPLYVVAFHGVERQMDGLVSLPLLAANTRSRGAAPTAEGFWGARWNPADWVHDEIVLSTPDETEALRIEKALTTEATRSTQKHWQRTCDRYSHLMVRVTRHLRDIVRNLQPVTDDMVVYWFDEEGGVDLAARTIPKRLVEQHFTPQIAAAQLLARRAVEPGADQAKFLVTRFGMFEGITHEMAQQQLRELGEVAIPSLLGIVNDPKNGWTAAKVLGQIGIAAPDVVSMLRAQAGTSAWHAKALGMLGDLEWLSHQDPAVACSGLTIRLLALAYDQDGVTSPALDYRPLERWLDVLGDEALVLAEEALAPGSYIALKADDVDEALRGLISRHAVVRWHAASVSGHRGLGKKNGAKLLPALVRALDDTHPIVRRLAVLAIGRWRSSANQYRGAVSKLCNDTDEIVARSAKHVLGLFR